MVCGNPHVEKIMQRPPLLVAGRAADRLHRLTPVTGTGTRTKLHENNLEHAIGSLEVSIYAGSVLQPRPVPGTECQEDHISTDLGKGAFDEVLMTPETLVRHGVVHRSFIQVCNPTR